MISLRPPIAAALNHLLSRQPALAGKLAAHAGKVAMIDVGLLQLQLQVGADGLLQPAAADAPQVSIRLDPADLPVILSDLQRAFAHVSIHGDAEFARAISEIAQGLRWDAEEDLAPLVGNVAAVRLAGAARAAADSARTGGRRLVENLAEYLIEENPTLMARPAGDAFASQVAVLRDDVERLGKRIALLEKRAPSSTGGTA